LRTARGIPTGYSFTQQFSALYNGAPLGSALNINWVEGPGSLTVVTNSYT